MIERSRLLSLFRVIAPRIALALTSVLLSVAVVEWVLQITSEELRAPDEREAAARLPCDCPYIYGHNSEHPAYNTQGLRADQEYTTPKPKGIKRILILGDSVAYGYGITQEEAMPAQLERILRGQDAKIEVLNAAVTGYTAYNELHYYLEEGRKFEPDWVVVVFCFNDVADPLMHWDYTGQTVQAPPESIPNPAYHREKILPLLDYLSGFDQPRDSIFDASLLYRRTRVQWQSFRRRLNPEIPRRHPDPFVDAKGRRWPVHLTGEQPISMAVLTDYESAEWRWLRSMYSQLHAAVLEDGVGLSIVWVPLAYQLHSQFPLHPEEQFERYCRESGIQCLDLLPTLQRHLRTSVFLGDSYEKNDVWHLSPFGSKVAARKLADHLKSILESDGSSTD